MSSSTAANESLASIARSLQTIAEILEPYRATIMWRVCYMFGTNRLKPGVYEARAAQLGVGVDLLRYEDMKDLWGDDANRLPGPSEEQRRPRQSRAECEAIIQDLHPNWRPDVWIEVFTFGHWMRVS